MKRQPKTGNAVVNCPYQERLTCANRSDCASCGWNPDSGVRERRVQAVLRDRRKKLRDGRPPVRP